MIISLVDNQLIELAMEGTINYAGEQIKEIEKFIGIENDINDAVEKIKGNINGNESTGDSEKDDENGTINKLIGKYVSDKNQEVEDRYGNKIIVPVGFCIVENGKDNVEYKYAGNGIPTVQDGVVIQDEEGNEFVWIPVGKVKNADGSTNEIILGRYTFETDGTPTLVQGIDKCKENIDAVTIYSTSTAWCYETLINTDYVSPANYLEEFINRTQINGGYYLARYEASKGKDGKAKSKANEMPWVSITEKEAVIESAKMYTNNNFLSDIVNSYAWDTAILFIQIYSGENQYSRKYCSNSTILETGLSQDQVCNINDISGNCFEWSTEVSRIGNGTTGRKSIVRGGQVGSTRSYSGVRNGPTMYASYNIGTFRILIFI